MARSGERATPASLVRLGERIEEWRRTRLKRTAMAPELWATAVRLSQEHGAYQVARATRISFACLKRRMAEATAPGTTRRKPSETFVEWSGAEILSGSSPGGSVLELSDATGTRLTLRLGGDVEVDVVRLVAAFRQRVE